MLLSLYLALTVFGVLITAADMVMLAGSHEGGSHDSEALNAPGHIDSISDTSADSHVDSFADSSTDSHADFNAHLDHSDANDFHVAHGHDDSGAHDISHDTRTSLAGLDKKNRFNPVLRLLQGFRMAVYFSLGFGPVGLFSVMTGIPAAVSLLYSIPTGVVALAGALGLRKLLSRELNSQLEESSLIFSPAQVIVPIFPGQIGKVRIRAGGAYVDRFAKAADENSTFAVGVTVTITDTTGDTFIVEDS